MQGHAFTTPATTCATSHTGRPGCTVPMRAGPRGDRACRQRPAGCWGPGTRERTSCRAPECSMSAPLRSRSARSASNAACASAPTLAATDLHARRQRQGRPRPGASH